ncbi:MAG: ATP-grasp domain-containing protein [Candidatus Bathyarchaeota archaeon]|nr:MAG: ATP-grasp domain-containing protein [Candidatus Bathyarchaeota archaeon]
MNLLIVEWISGGGYSGQTISSSIFSEGYSMLRSLISDCKAAGHNVTIFLDSRLAAFNLPNKADKIISLSSREEFYKKTRELSSSVDGVYVIAPESDQVLETIVKTVEEAGGTSLNCSSEAIKRVSNKKTTYETLKNCGLQVPETIVVNTTNEPSSIKSKIKKLGYPLIFKALDGVSCAGLSIVKTEKNIPKALEKVRQETTNKQFIVQKRVKGKAASVSVFSDGKNAVAVTLNQQFVTLTTPDEDSSYYGGAIPFKHPLEHEALTTAKNAVETLGGLKGYVGVDMVLTNKGPIVIEVNPRLTVSYVGLRKVVNFNAAQAIIDAVVDKRLPKNVHTKGYTFFSKIELPSSSQKTTETYNLKEIVSPPFLVEENKLAYTFVVTCSNTSKGAQSAFYKTKKRLLSNYKGD